MEELGFPVKFWLSSLLMSLALSCLTLRSTLPATSWKLGSATQLCLISRVSGAVLLCLQKCVGMDTSLGKTEQKMTFFLPFTSSKEVGYLGESNSKIFLSWNKKEIDIIFLKEFFWFSLKVTKRCIPILLLLLVIIFQPSSLTLIQSRANDWTQTLPFHFCIQGPCQKGITSLVQLPYATV